jgi:hypothetical protein
MLHESDFDADPLAHDVLSVWRTASGVSEGFKALFEKMQAYHNAKAVADNRRKNNMLTAQYIEQELKAKKEFLDSYRAFYEARTNVAWAVDKTDSGGRKAVTARFP